MLTIVSATANCKPESTTIDHYSGPGEALAWTSEGGEQWTRNIPGIDGGLDAIETSSGATTLQLHDLQGNIVATAALSETETKLLSTYNSTEFGVPSEGKAPPKYSWLGGGGVSTELASGVATAGGSSYVPEIGRPLQTGPIASPGSFPDGTASVGVIEAPYLGAASAQLMVLAAQEGAAREEAKRIEAEERAYEEEGFCEKYPDSSACHVDGPGEGNCEVNCARYISAGGVEESACEYAVETGQDDEGCLGTSLGLGVGGLSTGDALEVGSRCEQYGGHWVKSHGHWECKGIPSKENTKATCSTIAASVEAPYVWNPSTWVPFAVGIGLCQLF